jgi:hypothetical protein
MNTNHTRLLNRVAVRDYTLATLAEKRPDLAAKFTRISANFYAKAQGYLANWIDRTIETMPSAGKTIR